MRQEEDALGMGRTADFSRVIWGKKGEYGERARGDSNTRPLDSKSYEAGPRPFVGY